MVNRQIQKVRRDISGTGLRTFGKQEKYGGTLHNQRKYAGTIGKHAYIEDICSIRKKYEITPL